VQQRYHLLVMGLLALQCREGLSIRFLYVYFALGAILHCNHTYSQAKTHTANKSPKGQ